MTKENTIAQGDLDKFREEVLQSIDDKFNEIVDAICNAGEESEKEVSQEVPENPVSTARYILFSNGNKFFATDIKQNELLGIDFYLHEIDQSGKEYNSYGTITSQDLIILDLDPEMSLEQFQTKKNIL